MAPPSPVVPVKYFVAILWGSESSLNDALVKLSQQWGTIDFQGSDYPFDVTDYYVVEMGTGLQRRMVTFEALMPPDAIAGAKLRCNELEDELAVNGRRTVNLDLGYLDHNKIVLASLKSAGQKIYLSQGVYADLVARFRDGRYVPFEWTFPDFRDGRYDGDLATIRSSYLRQLRVVRQKSPD